MGILGSKQHELDLFPFKEVNNKKYLANRKGIPFDFILFYIEH